jgi:hypothetical protein
MKIAATLLGVLLFLQGCDDEESEEAEVSPGPAQPTAPDLLPGQGIANQVSMSATGLENEAGFPALGSGDLNVLGLNANENQAAFRQQFGLSEPSPSLLASWQAYDARLTEYSNKDPDWPFPTAASSNWMDSTWRGDPLAIAGTTVAVDFTRIQPGSLLYIPSLDMYAEANDTGATREWAETDSGLSDYGANGAGRIDIYNLAGDRSAAQVERAFADRIGNSEFGKIYIVSRGDSWKYWRR